MNIFKLDYNVNLMNHRLKVNDEMKKKHFRGNWNEYAHRLMDYGLYDSFDNKLVKLQTIDF